MPKKPENKKKQFQLVKGMKDILPQDARYWRFLDNLAHNLATLYGFQKIETPILENSDLFIRSIGQVTDIIEKEMYAFEDQGGNKLALRPESTAGIARAYIEHGMQTLPQPVKLYYFGPMFRRDKPQAGRYRQFYQIGFEVIGEADAITDAQIILIAYKFAKTVNLPCIIQLNSVGCLECRPNYEQELKDYFKRFKNKLSEISKERLNKNVLRILDSKEEEDMPIIADCPQQIDFLCENCKNHFIQVLEYLDELEIPYNLNSKIVRGLDYYTRTAFEIFFGEADSSQSAETCKPCGEADRTCESTCRQSALGGGGRYDGLIETLGGQETPAVGFALGVERFINHLKDNDIKVQDSPKPEIFLAQIGPEARKKALSLFEQLNEAGINVRENFAKSGLKAQLEMADRLGVKFTLILGQKEIIDGTVMIRDMENGIQELVDFQKVISEIKKRLEKSVVSGQ